MIRHALTATKSLVALLILVTCGCDTTRWTHGGVNPISARKNNCSRTGGKSDCQPCQSCQPGPTITETTLGVQLSQFVDIREIEVDYDELKRLLAVKEARARAEALRQRRLPRLREQQRQVLPNMPPNQTMDYVPAVPQAWHGRPSTGHLASQERQLSQSELNQMPAEADIVVAIDEYGNPVEQYAPRPRIDPFEIPYKINLRVNMSMMNGPPQSVRARSLICPPSHPSGRRCNQACGEAHPTGHSRLIAPEQSSATDTSISDDSVRTIGMVTQPEEQRKVEPVAAQPPRRGLFGL